MTEATKHAQIGYASQISAIARQVNNLIQTDQEISIQLSNLLNKLSNQTLASTLAEIQKTEQLIRRNYTFSIVGGSIALGLVLLFILLIINDVNKGKAARQALKQILETRHQLLLSVSHDIKSPLNSILGQLEIQKGDKTFSEKQISSMLNSGNHILALLENLLEFSSLEQGTLIISENNFNVYELCLEIAEMFIPLAQRKNLSFEYELTIDKDVMVCGDVIKIKQIAINILSNAIKYTSKGKIGFLANYKNEKLYFHISDTGAGIPEDQIETLFEPFTRVEENKNLASGSGLGMYVVKGLMDLLHGNIIVDSEVNKGTTVKISIPIHPIQKETTKFSAQKILVIDDDQAMLVVIKDMFLCLGYDIKTCENPEKLEESGIHLDNYDLIITDMEMGEISGIDILNEVRATHKNIPVIIMTGHADFNEKQAIEAGFNGFLPKPVTMKMLEQLTGKKIETKNAQNEFSSIEEMFGDDKDTLDEILKIFTQTTKENIIQLQETLSGDDFSKARSTCHKMLPMFQQMNALECVETLKWMDSANISMEEKLPGWKEKIAGLIVDTEKFLQTL